MKTISLAAIQQLVVDNRLHSLDDTVFVELAKMPPRQFLLDRLNLERGTLVSICGTGASGKTLFAQHLALCLTQHRDLFGRWAVETGQHRVLHIDMEQTLSLTNRRYVRLAAGMGIAANQITGISRKVFAKKIDDPSRSQEETEKELIAMFTGYSVVLIDSIRQSILCDENNSQVGTLLGLLKRVAEKCNCAILFIHHKGKNTESGNKQTGRGSSAFYDGVDIQIDLYQNDASGIVELSCAKNRDGLRWRGLSYQIQDDGDWIESQKCTNKLLLSLQTAEMEHAGKSKMLEVLTYLSDGAGRMLTMSEMRSMIGGRHTTVDKMIEDMLQQKMIKEEEKRGKARVFSIGENGSAYLMEQSWEAENEDK